MARFLSVARRYAFCAIYSLYVVMIIVRYGFIAKRKESSCV